MKWLLVFLAFEMQPDGSMVGRMHGTQPFTSEAECQEAGRNFRTAYPIPDNWDTLSVCINDTAFQKGLTLNGVTVEAVPSGVGLDRSSQK